MTQYKRPLTYEEIEIANKNGIDPNLRYKRYYALDWTPERTITEPRNKPGRPPKYPKKWLEVARKNGLSDGTYYSRLKKGMKPEDAATKRVLTPSEVGKIGAARLAEERNRYARSIF